MSKLPQRWGLLNAWHTSRLAVELRIRIPIFVHDPVLTEVRPKALMWML